MGVNTAIRFGSVSGCGSGSGFGLMSLCLRWLSEEPLSGDGRCLRLRRCMILRKGTNWCGRQQC